LAHFILDALNFSEFLNLPTSRKSIARENVPFTVYA
jgi:hypothetical protein